VHKSWDVFFRQVDAGRAPGAAFTPPPSVQSISYPLPGSGAASGASTEKAVSERLALSHLIRAYSVRGHEVAVLDPLALRNRPIAGVKELDFRSHGFSEADLDREFDVRGVAHLKGFLGASEGAGMSGRITLRALISRLEATYCGNIGWEYMHMNSQDKCNWIRERVELAKPPTYSREKRLHVFDRLAYSDQFERYLANKFNTAKRFGLEGCESLIPGLKSLVDRATELGVEHVTVGMPHRGRLNVLVNVIRKPMELLLKEFQGTHVDLEQYEKKIASGDWSGSGDVKYHLGTSYDRTYPDGRKVHMALVANPSHLEAVNTVVTGKVRAKQELLGDAERSKVMGVLLHGDAAFAGQGIVYETFLLSQLANYGTGGTVHIICNNQVGFTTDPESARSTLHSSDLGKAFDVPIFHVNADDPEAVTRVFELCAEYRQQFKTDVIIDLVGYRKYGHNELDQPMFTQPVMYAKIAKHPSALELYQKRLVSEGAVTEAELSKQLAAVNATFAAAWEKSKTYEVEKEDWLAGGKWGTMQSPSEMSKIKPTGVPLEQLRSVGRSLVTLPADLKLHASLQRIMKAKEEMVTSGQGFDWATAEALAFGTLLLEGNRVRLSGQDVERGTFSHRHAVLHDQLTNKTFSPLANLGDKQAPFTVCNSPLSEYGVMGFELGYSMESPDQLVLWEAQFGDFVNGAQIIIDQFLSAQETKWHRQSNLTLLLPHGMEGQGPEHSSCRIERFLQQVDDQENIVPPMAEEVRKQIQHTNMQVVNVTTPANYFHVLRRQVHRSFRKPLVVAAPKSLLRHKDAVSSYAEMADGSKFQRTYPDAYAKLAPAKKVRKLILCSGKVYYDLNKYRAEHAAAADVAICRVEQIAPFPFDRVAAECKRFPNAQVVWVQEEPRNMGAWTYVAPRIETATRVLNGKEQRAEYAGRRAEAAPASGSSKIHEAELNKFMAEAFA
jgi:2-oxoglutarate dehydrogenase E1 component